MNSIFLYGVYVYINEHINFMAQLDLNISINIKIKIIYE